MILKRMLLNPMEHIQKPKFKWIAPSIIFSIGIIIEIIAYIMDPPVGFGGGWILAAVTLFIVLPILAIGAVVSLILFIDYLAKRNQYKKMIANQTIDNGAK